MVDGESPFESYRQLGEIAVATAFGDEPLPPAQKLWAVGIIDAARKHLGTEGGKSSWIDAWLSGLK